MRATRPEHIAWLASVALLTLSFPLVVSADSPLGFTESQPSWGLGVVLTDGANLQGGGRVEWRQVQNVSVIVKVPNITLADGTTYAILSLMTADGVVLQTALGIYPGGSQWLVYSMFLGDITQNPQVYHWAINSSTPASSPGQDVSLSIYHSRGGGWAFQVKNLQTNASSGGPFDAGAGPTLMEGSQEVFALESYSGNPSTFQGMGNLTLESVYLDGRRASGGWGTYGAWDPSISLPFVVGGANPPPWVGLWVSSQGKAGWFYSGDPNAVWSTLTGGGGATTWAGLLTVSIAMLCLTGWFARRGSGSQEKEAKENGVGGAE